MSEGPGLRQGPSAASRGSRRASLGYVARAKWTSRRAWRQFPAASSAKPRSTMSLARNACTSSGRVTPARVSISSGTSNVMQYSSTWNFKSCAAGLLRRLVGAVHAQREQVVVDDHRAVGDLEQPPVEPLVRVDQTRTAEAFERVIGGAGKHGGKEQERVLHRAERANEDVVRRSAEHPHAGHLGELAIDDRTHATRNQRVGSEVRDGPRRQS